MTDSPKTTQLLEQMREAFGLAAGMALEGAQGIEQMVMLLRRFSHPELVTVMVPKDGPALEYPGIEGFQEALGDWITPYERFKLVIDEVITTEDKLVFMARQVGTTKHGGVDIETSSGSVWSLLDGTIRQVSFYIDPRAALQAAGLDPTEFS